MKQFKVLPRALAAFAMLGLAQIPMHEIGRAHV